MNTIILSLSGDLAALKGKSVGDECELDSVKLKVTANDGKTITATITELELGEEYESETEPEMDGSEEESGKSMAEMAMKSKE
jgi:hypothetical protein